MVYNVGQSSIELFAKQLLPVVNEQEMLKQRLIEAKRTILSLYNFKAYNLPKDFATSSYIIGANHLTDIDAPLIMSSHSDVMKDVKGPSPKLFVFAKGNCFDGVSVPKEFKTILEMENVIEIDRTNPFGSLKAIREAERLFRQDNKPKHFLIFFQGTIFDINNDKPEDVGKVVLLLSKVLGIPILPAFIEQAVEGELNRMIYGQAFQVEENCRKFEAHQKTLLESVQNLQPELKRLTGIPPRETHVDEAHQYRKKFTSAINKTPIQQK